MNDRVLQNYLHLEDSLLYVFMKFAVHLVDDALDVEHAKAVVLSIFFRGNKLAVVFRIQLTGIGNADANPSLKRAAVD